MNPTRRDFLRLGLGGSTLLACGATVPTFLANSARLLAAEPAKDDGRVLVVLQLDGGKIARARVVFGGAAPVPWRSKEVEEAITGRRLDDETVTRAAVAAVKNAQPLKQNGYKIPLFRGMIEEELTAMARV